MTFHLYFRHLFFSCLLPCLLIPFLFLTAPPYFTFVDVVCVCVHTHVSTCEDQRLTLALYGSPVYFLRQGLLLLLDWLASEPQTPPASVPNTGVTDTPPGLTFQVRAKDPNSGPHACG